MSRFLFLCVAWAAAAPLMHAAAWRPVAPEELAATKSSLDPNADAEALFRDVRILNDAATFGYPVNIWTEYVRLKIYTERGKEKYGTVQIPYWNKNIISGVEGRTITRSGTVLELKKDAIFDKVIEKSKGVKVKVISFAMPGVEPGAIIEYRWTKNVGEFISRYMPLEVQSEYPVRELIFHVKPVSNQWVHWPSMRSMNMGCNPDKVSADVGGFTAISLHNVPAFHGEPSMPPDLSAKQWILIYYEENDNTGKDKYWKSLGRAIYASYSPKIKINGETRDLANELTHGAANDDEKLQRLYDYCRNKLKDIHGNQITTEQRDAAKQNRTTADTLAHQEGTASEISLAFAALAIAAGFDARVARLADRTTFLFNPMYQSEFFLDSEDIAVKVNGSWKFYDVTDRSLAPGQLRWQEQGVFALITDPKDPEFVQTPLLGSKASAVQRIGNFILSPEGELDGDVREIYTGNKAAEWRERFNDSNDAEREEALRNDLKEKFAEFDLSDVKFHVPADAAKGLTVMYRIKIQGYAQRTGKRLFVVPDLFESGVGARFTAETRLHPIYFDYPWSETDVVSLQLPDGYRVDHGDAPGPLDFPPIGNYKVKISLANKNTIQYQRDLVFGSSQVLLFDAKAYPTLKQVFERIHAGDSHMLTLKPATEASAELQ
jgi:hypothetical protein